MNEELLQYSIVIPVYNSGAWLDELIERIGKVMDQEAPGQFELILVNDCSPDTITWPTIIRNAEKYPWIRGFNLLYNVHQFKATICGMEQARGKFVLTMDDDLQHLPEELPKLIQAMREDENVLCVMGRYETKQHNAFRNQGSRLYQNIMNQLYAKPAGIQTTSFRIMRKEFVDAIVNYRTTKPQMGPLIVELTRKIKNIPVQHAPRENGTSGYSLWYMVNSALESVIYASTAPLRCFSAVGFACSAGSLVLALAYFVRWLSGGIGVAGYTSQILLITFFGGMTLAGIGVLGEYISRIIEEVSGPERFRIKDTVNGEAVNERVE